MQHKFDMGRAWSAGMAMFASHRELVLAIAGVFFFLPSLLLGVFGPSDPGITSGMPRDEVVATAFRFYGDLAPWILAAAITSTLGNLAIARLYLSPQGESVGGALTFALTMVLSAIVAAFLASLVSGFALLLLIVPGLYLYARLALIVPHAAATGDKNPIGLIGGSWNATQGNGWRVLLYLVLIAIIAIVVYFIVFGILNALVIGAAGQETGRQIVNVLSSIVTTIFGVATIAILCGAYRELTGPGDRELSDEFA